MKKKVGINTIDKQIKEFKADNANNKSINRGKIRN